MSVAPTPHAIILFAHGSRDALWAKPIEAVADAIARQSSNHLVRCAYLELMQPNLTDAVADLAVIGVRCIRIVPMFLGVGKHAKEDLPKLIELLQLTYPSIKFELIPPVGENPRIIDCMAQVALATMLPSDACL